MQTIGSASPKLETTAEPVMVGYMQSHRLGRKWKLGQPCQALVNWGKCLMLMMGEAAFPLITYFVRPYPGKGLPKEKEILCYRSSRQWMVVKCRQCGIGSMHLALYLLTPQDASSLQREAEESGRALQAMRQIGANRAGRAAYNVQNCQQGKMWRRVCMVNSTWAWQIAVLLVQSGSHLASHL